MTTEYPNSLGDGVWDAMIGTVRVRWGPNPQQRLQVHAESLRMDPTTVKALTEHFLHALAIKRGNTAVLVM